MFQKLLCFTWEKIGKDFFTGANLARSTEKVIQETYYVNDELKVIWEDQFNDPDYDP